MKRRIAVLFSMLLVSSSWKSRAFPVASKLIDSLTSSNNKVIRRGETVVFFPTSSYRSNANDEQSWIVPIHGWIFDAERRWLRREAFLALLRSALDRGHHRHAAKVERADDDDEQILLKEAAAADKSSAVAKEVLGRRVLPFVVDNHRRRKITVRIGNLERELPERSRKNGHFNANLQFSDNELADAMRNSVDNTSS